MDVAHDWTGDEPKQLADDEVHVWRIRIDCTPSNAQWTRLSADERERAARFHFDEHRHAYVVAHAELRAILALYSGRDARSLVFALNEFGKPSLVTGPSGTAPRFNLSHSGGYALLAVAQSGEVGVDVERWHEEAEHLELSERFFSPAEREALRALTSESSEVVRGFFAAWSRKEAYLKARGYGITQGLDHFDVSLAPAEIARLLTDRTDEVAHERWSMAALDVAPGYSAAVVAERPVSRVVLVNRAHEGDAS